MAGLARRAPGQKKAPDVPGPEARGEHNNGNVASGPALRKRAAIGAPCCRDRCVGWLTNGMRQGQRAAREIQPTLQPGLRGMKYGFRRRATAGRRLTVPSALS